MVPMTDKDTDVEYGISATIQEVVEICERYGEELFDGEEYFTQVTKWQDGDFRVTVHHGKGHAESPYRQSAQQVTYRHEDGAVVFSDFTHLIDRHRDEYHESKVLELPFEPVSEIDDAVVDGEAGAAPTDHERPAETE